VVNVGFVVEGDSDKIFIESVQFRTWAKEKCKLKIVDPVVNAEGKNNMCSEKIPKFVQTLKIQAQPDKIVVLADLDPEKCAPCITKRKEIIGEENIDLVVIARKALESWFLADTQAMKKWLENEKFFEENPEETEGMPWERLKEIAKDLKKRGPGPSKLKFAQKFISNFDVERAAQHPSCPSAHYFVKKLCVLGNTNNYKL